MIFVRPWHPNGWESCDWADPPLPALQQGERRTAHTATVLEGIHQGNNQHAHGNKHANWHTTHLFAMCWYVSEMQVHPPVSPGFWGRNCMHTREGQGHGARPAGLQGQDGQCGTELLYTKWEFHQCHEGGLWGLYQQEAQQTRWTYR